MNTETRAGVWRPLLEGEPAVRAWEAIEAVARDLLERQPPQEAPAYFAGLAGGSAGLALFFAYLSEAHGEDRGGGDDAERAVEYLDHSSDAVAATPMMPGLYSGFTGVCWTADHLGSWFFEAEDEDEDENEIDSVLVQMLDGRSWSGDYDLISGLVGFAVYALEAIPRPGARRLLEVLVTKLEDSAVAQGVGRTWFTPPELLVEHQLEICPNGYYNLGVAHGMPAVIAVLARVAAAGIETGRVRTLLDDAVRWLLSQELPAGAGSAFPSWVGEGYESTGSRLAWCYGDPGVASTLLWAARSTGREDWEREALRIARAAAARSREDSTVKDAGICHGAAGLGHLFNRLYQATGDRELGRAARFWFGRTLDMRQPGEGIGGFLSWTTDQGDDLDWRTDPGFLTGSCGIALALLGAVTGHEPAWDRILLTAVPPL